MNTFLFVRLFFVAKDFLCGKITKELFIHFFCRFWTNYLLIQFFSLSPSPISVNINNSAASAGSGTGGGETKQQQQSPEGQQSQQQQQAQQNKISDSDVLIPTSNLQKFIESADKILKNISSQHQVMATADTINKCKFNVEETTSKIRKNATKSYHLSFWGNLRI